MSMTIPARNAAKGPRLNPPPGWRPARPAVVSERKNEPPPILPTTHRQDLHREREYNRAVWGKRARQAGIDPQQLHDLAGQMLAHDREFKSEHTKMLQTARKRLGEFGSGKGKRRESKGLRLPTFQRRIPWRFPFVSGQNGTSAKGSPTRLAPRSAKTASTAGCGSAPASRRRTRDAGAGTLLLSRPASGAEDEPVLGARWTVRVAEGPTAGGATVLARRAARV